MTLTLLKKIIYPLLSFCVWCLLSSCSLLPSFPKKNAEPSAEQKQAWQHQLQNGWQYLATDQNELAYKTFTEFQKENPQSVFDIEARLGEAQSLEQLEEYPLAHKIYREIATAQLGLHPNLAALALFASSRTAEAMGQENETRAALLDAENMKEHLPSEIQIAALPARLAISELKVGNADAAKKYLKQADTGIAILKRQNASPQTWAKLYFEMGSFSTHQLNRENLKVTLDGFQQGQIFLLQAIESGAQPWADRALSSLQKHYQELWNFALNPEVSHALDRDAQERIKVELRRQDLSAISILSESLKQYYSPDSQNESSQMNQLKQFISDLDNEIQKQLSSQANTLPLTQESQNRLRKTKSRNRQLPLKLPKKYEDHNSDHNLEKQKSTDPNLKTDSTH